MAGYFWVLYSGGWHWGDTLDADNHLYLEATTMTWAGIVATQVGTAMTCRTNRVSRFSGLVSGPTGGCSGESCLRSY